MSFRDRTRRAILEHIRDHTDVTAQEIAKKIGCSRPNVQYHLRFLTAARLVGRRYARQPGRITEATRGRMHYYLLAAGQRYLEEGQ